MFTSVERLIAIRNLKPKRKEGFLKVISIFSFVGIMLGVAILIIVMSVMNGFRTELTNKILGFNPHITIKPYNNAKIDLMFKNKLKKNFPDIQIIDSFSGEGVVINNDYAKGIMIKGLDPENNKNSDFILIIACQFKNSLNYRKKSKMGSFIFYLWRNVFTQCGINEILLVLFSFNTAFSIFFFSFGYLFINVGILASLILHNILSK